MPAQHDGGFIPALRFKRLTPLFDFVAAVAVHDRAIKRRVLAHAAIASGEHVLDLGCGTGTLALATARAAQGVTVTGLDADASILARARKKAARAGLEIGFDEGRSTALPYADASFDIVLSTLFFHDLPDDAKRQTAAELVRVLRPGGRLVVGDLGQPQDPFMRAAVRATTQLLDGVATTALNVRGELPDVLAGAGLCSGKRARPDACPGRDVRNHHRQPPTAMSIKLHRCRFTFLRSDRFECYRVQKALDDQGVDYEVVRRPTCPGAAGRTLNV